MSTSYRNGVKAYSMLSGIKPPLLTLADTLITAIVTQCKHRELDPLYLALSCGVVSIVNS